MEITRTIRATLLAAALAVPAIGRSQVTPATGAAPAPVAPGPAIGSVAPDFTLPGATRYGLLRTPVRLSDYRGQTVVLAFFVVARTKG
jgi:hypothetical protein